ncbi:MAG: hypothetical protein ABIP48_20650 [Planctomycetota bacterium]
MKWSTELGCLVAASAIAVIGCSGSGLPDTVPITGLVTYNGEPVAEAQVSFIPAQGRPASGGTGADGRFKLTTFQLDDGAVLGEHTVTIAKTAPTPGQEDDPYAEQISLIPEKYGKLQDSPLKATVSADGPSEFKFDLTD